MAEEHTAMNADTSTGEGGSDGRDRADVHTRDLVKRLRSIEGHVRGIQRMVEEGAYCIDVVNQILAVQKALGKVSGMVLDRHLHHCVIQAIRGPDEAAREQVLGELMQVFQASGRS